MTAEIVSGPSRLPLWEDTVQGGVFEIGLPGRIREVPPAPAEAPTPARLTAKQRAALDLVCRGRTYAEAGVALGIGAEGVAGRLHDAYRVLGVRGRAAACVLLRASEEG